MIIHNHTKIQKKFNGAYYWHFYPQYYKFSLLIFKKFEKLPSFYKKLSFLDDFEKSYGVLKLSLRKTIVFRFQGTSDDRQQQISFLTREFLN